MNFNTSKFDKLINSRVLKCVHYQMADSLFKLLVFALAIVQLKEETVYHFPQVTIGDLKLLDDDLKGNSF